MHYIHSSYKMKQQREDRYRYQISPGHGKYLLIKEEKVIHFKSKQPVPILIVNGSLGRKY